MVQQNLNNLITSLLNEKVIQNVGNDNFQCACGSILKRKSIKKHITTKAHTSFYEVEKKEEEKEATEKIECACGSKVLRSGMKKHLNTKKHIAFQAEEKKEQDKAEEKKEEKKDDECSICMTDKSEFFVCIGCRNKHCWSCHEKLIAPTCPFCRKYFEGEVREENKVDDDSFYDEESDEDSDEDSDDVFDSEAMSLELTRLIVVHRRDQSQLSRDLLNSMIWNYIDHMADFLVDNIRIPRQNPR